MRHFNILLALILLISCGKSEKKDAVESVAEKSAPRLERVSYQSEATGKERDYYVYLPEGYDQQEKWPVMLFLHGNGERGDGKEQLDYVFIHGPIFEAWVQKRKLPFVIVVPQLPIFGQGVHNFITRRTLDIVPYPKEEGLQPYRTNYDGEEVMNGIVSDSNLPYEKEGQEDGWNKIENELLSMLDEVNANFKGDSERTYLTGLSTGGFGVWYMGGTYPERFAAMAPITAFGHPDLAPALVEAKMPLWNITGGRDPHVKMEYFYPVLNRLEELNHPEVRFTVHEDMGHIAWQRAYQGNDLYDWFLSYSRKEK
ncbi:MAG: alpha/beta hydrolase [Maribacter sp.]|nr:MAG: alpha/beta hydrolase [Maribacter sp.]